MARSSFNIGEDLLRVVWHIVGIFSTIIISRYDPSHSSKPILCPTWPTCESWAASWRACAELKIFPSILASYGLDDPSPAMFVGAVAIFTLAALLMHTMDEDDQSRNHLLMGVVGAFLMSSVRQYMAFDETWPQSIRTSLPPGTVATLLISGIWTQVHRGFPSDRGTIRGLDLPSKNGEGTVEWRNPKQ